MVDEIEIKFLDIDTEEILEKLESIGANKVGSFLQKRYVYDIKKGDKSQWLRLRSKGDKTTLTFKKIEDTSISGTKEIEISVDSFERTSNLLKVLGYIPKSYQENRRISFVVDGCEVEIDQWPKIPAYLEIEAKNEEAIKNLITRLGLDYKKSTTMNTLDIYKKYGIDLEEIKKLTF